LLKAAKYFADRQQYKGNPLLHFLGNTELSYIACRCTYASSNKKGAIVVFPWQQ